MKFSETEPVTENALRSPEAREQMSGYLRTIGYSDEVAALCNSEMGSSIMVIMQGALNGESETVIKAAKELPDMFRPVLIAALHQIAVNIHRVCHIVEHPESLN